jgi:hypothetical protein
MVFVPSLLLFQWQSEVGEMGGACGTQGAVRKSEVEIPLGKQRRECEDNIKIGFKVIRLCGVRLINLCDGRNSSGLAWTGELICRFHKMREIYLVPNTARFSCHYLKI